MNKKNIGKFLALGLCGVMALATCAACGEGGGGGGSTGEKVTLVVWLPKEDQDFGREVAEAFKAAHPEKEYKITFGEQAESDASNALLNDVTNAPDCFAFASDQLYSLINGGALNPVLGERLTTLKAENTADSVDAATATVNGEEITYAYPFTDNTTFLYYNKSKLTENDVKTLDGILAKCSTSERFGFPLGDAFYSSSFFFGAGIDYEAERDEAFKETKVTTNIGGDTGKAVTEAIVKYRTTPGFYGESNDSKIVSGFHDGSIIAGVSGIWNKTAIEKELGENFAAAPLPTYTLNGQQITMKPFAGYKLFGVCHFSENKADAHLFAQFFTNYENQVKHFEARGYNPTNKQAMDSEAVKNDVCVKAIQGVLQSTHTMKGVPTTWWDPVGTFGEAMLKDDFNLSTQLSALVSSIQVGV